MIPRRSFFQGLSAGLLIAFLLRSLAFAAEPAGDVFLFSYFMGNGEDGLHLAVSEDGLKWTALRDRAISAANRLKPSRSVVPFPS